MSVDDRLRAALDANARTFEPPVELGLDVVRRRGRRGRVTRVGLAVCGAAAAAAVVVGVVAGFPRSPGSAAPATPAPRPTGLFDRYEAEVTAPATLAGRWALELRGNGTLAATPPPGYTGVVSDSLISADATTLRVTLFARDVCAGRGTGTYRWSRTGSALRLTVTDDSCPDRTTFLTTAAWVAAPRP